MSSSVGSAALEPTYSLKQELLRARAVLFDWLIRKLIDWAWKNFDDPETCVHEWYVFSTAVSDVSLCLECYKCGSYGAVLDPTETEWEKAYYAPKKSYRWRDNKRVKPGSRIPKP